MLKIKSSAQEVLTFAIDVDGADEKDTAATFRITHEGIEYGFETTIKNKEVTVNLPALDTVMPALKDRDILESKLDVEVKGEFILHPWSDQISIEKPVQVKANVVESKRVEQTKPQVKVAAKKQTVVKEQKKDTPYQAYVRGKMKEMGIKSIQGLDKEKKKEFFEKVDKGWKSKDEKKESKNPVRQESQKQLGQMVDKFIKELET